MNFVTDLLVSTNWRGDSYDFILVIVNCLTNIVYDKPVKVTMDIPSLAKVIIDVVMYHHNIFKSIIMD